MEAEGRNAEPLSAPAAAGAGGSESWRLRLLRWIGRPAGQAATAVLAAALACAVTLALTSLRRVPEGWVGVPVPGGSLLGPGRRFFALRGSSVPLFPTRVDLASAPLRVRAAGGEILRGRLDLRGELSPDAIRALAAAAANAPPPEERARAAVIAAVESALAVRQARELVESSPFSLRTPSLLTADVERGVRIDSSQVDLLSAISLRALAARLYASGGSDAVRAFLADIAAQRPREAAPLCVQGDLARLQGELGRAEALYLEALELDPADLDSMAGVLALAKRTGENYERAERLLRKALSLRPDSVPHLDWLSQVLVRRGDLQGAEGALLRALSIEPDNPDTAVSLALLMNRRGRRDEAIDQLRRVLNKHPDHPLALYNLGSALLEQGDTDGAIAAFDHAERISPRPSAQLYTHMATAYEKRGDAAKAATYRERAAQVQREAPPAEASED